MASPLDKRSIELRLLVLRAVESARRGHLGSAFSLIEIMRVLYDSVLNYKAHDPSWHGRDRCILSKGHGCLAQYAILADKGFFPARELELFCTPNGILGGHPEYGKIPGIEASTGSLGHGLSIGVGFALNAKLQKRSTRVYVVIGDGESNEGSIWEAALSAASNNLNNLTVIVDYNNLQSYGPLRDVVTLEPVAMKWESFGFETLEVDGHSVTEITSGLKSLATQPKPSALICHTTKGYGVDFAENNPDWHHKSSISDTEMEELLNALVTSQR